MVAQLVASFDFASSWRGLSLLQAQRPKDTSTMGDDPFAKALLDDAWSSADEGEGLADAGEVRGELAASAAPPSVTNAHDDQIVTKKRRLGRPKKGSTPPKKPDKKKPRKTRKAAPDSQLRRIEPSDDPVENKLHVIFIKNEPNKGRASAKANTPKRHLEVPATPILLWPLYEIDNLVGHWIVINPHSEDWLQQMLHHLRQPSDKTNSAKIMRKLTQACRTAVKVLLRKALASQQQPAKDETLIDDGSEDEGSGMRRTYTLSGWTFNTIPAFKAQCAGMPVSILNYGNQMVMQLDEDAVRFVQIVLTDLIKKLSETGDEEPKPSAKDTEPVANFRFDDSTPNIFGKVVWDTDKNSWKVTHGLRKGVTAHTYKDYEGADLSVPDELSGTSHVAKKELLYKRAVDTWNKLDKTTRKRIPQILDITLDLTGSGKSSASGEDEDSQAFESPPLLATLAERWETDLFP